MKLLKELGWLALIVLGVVTVLYLVDRMNFKASGQVSGGPTSSGSGNATNAITTFSSVGNGVAITQTVSQVSNLVFLSFTNDSTISITKQGTTNILVKIPTTATPTLAGLTVTASSTLAGVSNSGRYASGPILLSYATATNVVVDLSLGDNFYLPVTNTTWLIFSNVVAGQSGYILCTNDATGGYSISYVKAAGRIITNATIVAWTTNASAQNDFYYTGGAQGTNVHVTLQAGYQ